MTTDSPILRVAVLEGFALGDDAVLVAMNSGGLDALRWGMLSARQHDSASFVCGGRTHIVEVADGAADMDLHNGDDSLVRWRLDVAKLHEISDMLAGMDGRRMCHNYVDISTPAETLVLSVDEYIVPNAVVHTSPFGYF